MISLYHFSCGCRFNPRTPCGVRRGIIDCPVLAVPFQSTHSLRSATFFIHRYYLTPAVSIHALLAECDGKPKNFSRNDMKFQSTHSLRSATRGHCDICETYKFQSTHSLRSATYKQVRNRAVFLVSIHALLAECDTAEQQVRYALRRFNPRTPCGVRPGSERPAGYLQTFQSTHSLRSATDFRVFGQRAVEVSIHALLAECDGLSPTLSAPLPCFNPRTPCGVRQVG